MSYEKVKCITRKPKENKIIITSACNNVRPLTFGKWEYGKADMSYKEKMFHLLRDINGGNLQLNNSCYEWNYAILKTKEYMQERYGKDYSLYDLTTMKYNQFCLGEQLSTSYIPITQNDIDNGNYHYVLEWENEKSKIYYIKEEYQDKKAIIQSIFEEYYNVFINFLEEKHSGKYYLYSESYGYIKPKGTNGSFYYSISGNIMEQMDYKKAFCLAKNIGKDIQIIAVPTRQYQPTQKQIAESKKRIELFGLEPRFSEKLYMSDRYFIREVNNRETALIKAINKFEKEYNAYVYHIIYNNSEIGDLFTMLYVSDNEQEWKNDKADIQKQEVYAYVWNKTDEVCSEIGVVGVKQVEHCNLLQRFF